MSEEIEFLEGKAKKADKDNILMLIFIGVSLIFGIDVVVLWLIVLMSYLFKMHSDKLKAEVIRVKKLDEIIVLLQERKQETDVGNKDSLF